LRVNIIFPTGVWKITQNKIHDGGSSGLFNMPLEGNGDITYAFFFKPPAGIQPTEELLKIYKKKYHPTGYLEVGAIKVKAIYECDSTIHPKYELIAVDDSEVSITMQNKAAGYDGGINIHDPAPYDAIINIAIQNK
jgi:hypothetical protein